MSRPRARGRPVRSRRRYGALSTQVRLGLAFGWLAVQWVAWQLIADTRSRVGVALVSLLALPIVVVLLRLSPSGRR